MYPRDYLCSGLWVGAWDVLEVNQCRWNGRLLACSAIVFLAPNPHPEKRMIQHWSLAGTAWRTCYHYLVLGIACTYHGVHALVPSLAGVDVSHAGIRLHIQSKMDVSHADARPRIQDDIDGC